MLVLASRGEVACASEVHDIEVLPDGGQKIAEGLVAEALHVMSWWRETDAQGMRLVDERGALEGVRLGWNGQVAGFNAGFHWETSSGDRHYNGHTNGGALAQSTTQASGHAWAMRLNKTVGNHWAPGVWIRTEFLDRTILSSGAAQGYTEHWQWTQVGASLSRSVWYGTHEWTFDTRWGTVLAPRLSVALPGRDMARLMPRHGRSVSVGADYRHVMAESGAGRWHWTGGLHWKELAFDASEAAPLFSTGVLRGAVFQPATRMRALEMRLGLVLDWR